MTRFGATGLLLGSLAISLFSAVAGDLAGGVVLLFWALGCSFALVAKVRGFARPDQLPWALVAGASLLISLGLLVRGIHGVAVGIDQPLPSPAELLHIPGYLMFFAAAIVIHRRRATNVSISAWLDSWAIGLGTLLLVWIGFLGTFVLDGSTSLAERALNLIYNGISLVTFAVYLRISATPGHRPTSYYLLGTAGALFFLIDIAGSSPGGIYLTVALSPLVFAFILLAAFDPSAERIADRNVGAEERISYARLGLLSFTIAAPLATYLLPTSLQDSTANTVFLTATTVLLAIVVLTRTALLLRVNQSATDLERRFAEEVATLSTATSPLGVPPAILAGANRLLGAGRSPRFVSQTKAEDHNGIVTVARLNDCEFDVLIADGRPLSTHESRVIESLLREGNSHINHLQHAEQEAQTNLREAELAITAANEQRFRSLLQNSSDAVAVFDQDGVVSFITDSIERLLGYTPEQLIGSTFQDVTHTNDWVFAVRHVRAVFAGDDSMREFELRAVHADGTVRLLECVLANMTKVEGIEGMVLNVADSTEVRELESDLLTAETLDPLTSLLNRRTFIKEIEAASRRASVRGSSVAIAVIDIDDFRSVNDGYGTAVGDRVLLKLASRIKRVIRNDDAICRLSGDRFGAMFPIGFSTGEVEGLLERILEVVKDPVDVEGHTIVLSATSGVFIDKDFDSDAVTILGHADTALDAAKQAHRGGLLHFRSEMGLEASTRIEIRNRLRLALSNGGLRLNFQPIVDLESGEVASLEALARWDDPVLGEISPGTFIPIAESSGLISDLGDWALRRACEHLCEWDELGFDHITVSVNMSGHQLRDDRTVEQVRAILKETGVAASRITIELTESVLLDDTNFTAERISKLRELGLRLAIDDFGTGYSSFGYLRRYVFDIVKIDRSFVAPLRDDKNVREREIVNAMIKLSQALGATTIGEGVEQSEEHGVLRTLGCDQAQGYLLFRPTEAQEIPELLRKEANPSIIDT